MKITNKRACETILEIQNTISQSAPSLKITDSKGNSVFEIYGSQREIYFYPLIGDYKRKRIKADDDITIAFVASILAMCGMEPKFRSKLKFREKRKLMEILEDTIKTLKK